jgi:elongation factor P
MAPKIPAKSPRCFYHYGSVLLPPDIQILIMATTADLSRGQFLRYNNDLVQVIEYEHRTPGNLRAFYQVKMRNIKSGKLLENRFRAGEEIFPVRVDVKDMQYLYEEGNALICMDTETYDQVPVDKVLFGDSISFLKEGMTLRISFDDQTPLMGELPSTVELEVTYTEPGIKGDTATRTLKPATVETGATVNIPLFVETGEKIRVNTQTGEYMERVK